MSGKDNENQKKVTGAGEPGVTLEKTTLEPEESNNVSNDLQALNIANATIENCNQVLIGAAKSKVKVFERLLTLKNQLTIVEDNLKSLNKQEDAATAKLELATAIKNILVSGFGGSNDNS